MFFKEPVPSRDHELNPVFIVADYEVRTGGEDETAARPARRDEARRRASSRSARAPYSKARRRATRSIVGSDLTWRVIARDASARRSRAVAVGRSAASGFLDRLAGRRQTRLRTPRSARLGARDRQRFRRRPAAHRRHRHAQRAASTRATSSPISLVVSGEVQHQHVLASEATRLLASADVRMQRDAYSAGGGARHVADEDASGDERVSDQAFVTASVDFWDGRFTLRGAADATLGGKDAERRLPGAQHPRRRLPPERRHHAVRRVRTRRGRPDRSRHHARRHAHASLGAHAGQFEHQHAGDRIRSAHLRELRPHAGLRVAGNTGHSTSASTRRNTLRGPDLEPLNPNAPLASGSHDRGFLRGLRGCVVPPRTVAVHQPPRASQLRHRGTLELDHGLVSRADRRPRDVGVAAGLRCESRCSAIRPTPWAASPGRSARIRAAGSCSTASS